MKLFFIFFFLFITEFSFPQTILNGSVKDINSLEPLPYCSIAIKGTKKNAITNEEGSFSLSVNLRKDTILFSYVGYDIAIVPATDLIRNKTIFLKSKQVLLKEFTLHATSDYLYDILIKCRKKILSDQTKRIAKVYYGIETQAKDQPIEQVECYYNGYLSGISVDKLVLKNGRIGLSGLDNRYFLTLNSSKAIVSIDLFTRNDNTPLIPFQFTKKEMKKKFILRLESTDDQTQIITFIPRDESEMRFSGKAWIDKQTYNLLKVDLSIKNTQKHPFLPFSKDSLKNVDMDISRTYNQEGEQVLLDHINFSYHVTYKSFRDSINAIVQPVISREINTKGILYFYDYNDPFILPYFDYDNDYDDYRKMSIIPYNKVFWENNTTLVLTEKQKENLGFFSHKGYLINFREGNYGKNFLKLPKFDTSQFFEYYYSFWSPDKRVSLNKRMKQNKPFTKEKINQCIQTDLYKLKVQILLDITQLGDSLNCRSYTVLDANKTFYHFPEDTCTNVFLNIYFDICEIERRKMQKEFDFHTFNKTQIDSIYNITMERMDKMTSQYLKEVRLGKDYKSLNKWNNFVLINLNIDNIAMFREKDDSTP